MADRFDRVARDLLPCDHEDDECTCGEYQASISTALREAFDEGRCERRRAYIAGVIAADEAEDRARELRRALDTTERPDIRTAMLMRALRAEYERGRAEEREACAAIADREWREHEKRAEFYAERDPREASYESGASHMAAVIAGMVRGRGGE